MSLRIDANKTFTTDHKEEESNRPPSVAQEVFDSLAQQFDQKFTTTNNAPVSVRQILELTHDTTQSSSEPSSTPNPTTKKKQEKKETFSTSFPIYPKRFFGYSKTLFV